MQQVRIVKRIGDIRRVARAGTVAEPICKQYPTRLPILFRLALRQPVPYSRKVTPRILISAVCMLFVVSLAISPVWILLPLCNNVVLIALRTDQ